MSKPKDKGSGGGDAPPSEAKATVGAIDPAIPSEVAAHEADPSPRASQLDLHAPLTYPDDGPLSRAVRNVDNLIGKVEQVLLVAIFATLVVVTSVHALSDKLFHAHVFMFKDDVLKAGTFAIAMLGGAFASHQAKHLSMDLLSRRFSPRHRLFLKITLGLFVVFVLVLLIRAGFSTIDTERGFAAEDKLLTRVRIAYLIPIAGAVMIFHTVLHMVIDVDYIARRKTPPERMRSGH